MAIRAAFIGIDKHVDPGIRELSGARRDATALWALFADSIPPSDMQSCLITDEAATHAAVTEALNETLGKADDDDVVVVSFSGHGTRDHRLVVNNTALASSSTTTIGMDEIAARFRSSKARAILLILDCCFSGGAPARVLDGTPLPRSPHNPLDELAGSGRILISASNIDEPAYEMPNINHGVLTKALIDVFAAGEPVELTGAMSQVMERVRAEAARLGVVQTPVLFGHVEGGLVLPSLRRGTRYAAAFPESVGIKIGSAIDELAAFGIPDVIVEAWKKKFPRGLNSLQLDAVNEKRILVGDALLVVAPTSSGKTFIGEMAAARAISGGRKAVFLLPYKALVNEKFEQFDELYGAAGLRVIRCSGDHSDETGTFIRGRYDLALLTYEMFLNLAVSNPNVLSQIGLVVVDEGQFLTDPMRGISVELLLTLIVAARSRGVSPQLIVLSAVIGDINHFDEWLGCQRLVTTERPVPLIEGIIDRRGVFQFRDLDGSAKMEQLVPAHEIRQRRNDPSAQDVIVPLVRQLTKVNEKVIVFRNQRGAAEGCALYLAAELGQAPATAALEQLPNHDLSSTSAKLRKALEGGTAFHNTNLTRDEKAIVERFFRDDSGGIVALGSTTTLAAGINTPASTVILAEKEFVGDEGRAFTVAEYKNMAGRAGRLGYNEIGRSVIYAETPIERDTLFRKYVLGTPEPMRSSFLDEDLRTWIIRLLAQVPKMPRREVTQLLASTYGGYLAARKSPSWVDSTERQLDQLITQFLSLGLLEEEGEDVRLTLLGRACGRSSLSFESSLRLVELIRSRGSSLKSAEEVMALVQALPESDGGYTPLMKRGRGEASRVGEASNRYGADTVRLLQRYADDEHDYWKRCKRAAILWDWIEGAGVEEIERRYSPNVFQGTIGHGDIRRFADATRYHLRAAHQILSVLFVTGGPSDEAMETLLARLELGLPASALQLAKPPLSLARGECLALVAEGIDSAAAVFAAAEEQLKRLLSMTRMKEIANKRSAA